MPDRPQIDELTVAQWLEGVEFERIGALRRLVKAVLIHPFVNYAPAGLLRRALHFSESELAHANWSDPGGWKSMVISYHGRPERTIDKLLVTLGTIPTALRNRLRLTTRVLDRLIAAVPGDRPVTLLALGAGPGHAESDAVSRAGREAHVTLVDLSADAFAHGHELAVRRGVQDQVRFIQGDVRDVATMLDHPPDIVTMIGICEYLDDEHVTDIVRAVADVAADGTRVVFNSLSESHGTDRFFRRVFGLHMNHREPAHLKELVEAGGFGDFHELAEPLGVYRIMIGRKGAAPDAGAPDA